MSNDKNKINRTWKIGNLPFIFTSRKQIGDYTIFDNGDSCQLKIRTDRLGKNTSLVSEQTFSEQDTNNDEILEEIQDYIDSSNKNILAYRDNMGMIILSDGNMDNDIILDPNSESFDIQLRAALKEFNIIGFSYLIKRLNNIQ